MDKYVLRIPNFLYQDPTFEDMDILAYACVLRNYPMRTSETQMIPISLQHVCFSLYESWDVSAYTKSEIGRALDRLLDRGVLKGIKVKNGHYCISDVTVTSEGNHYYAMVYFDDLTTIIKSPLVRCKAFLFRYLCLMCGSLSYNIVVDGRRGVIGDRYIKTYTSPLKIDYQSALRYNQLLEDLKIMYIVRRNESDVMSDGTVKRKSNIYGRYEDKALIDEYVGNIHKEYTRHNDRANRLRSVRQRYKSFVADPSSFSAQERITLYDQCLYLNETSRKAVDLTVFDNMKYLELTT